jgi:hypothetical protein
MEVGKEEEHESVRAYGVEERVWIREAESHRNVRENWKMRILIIQTMGQSNVSVFQKCYWLGGPRFVSR